jgi:hypothetical protein
MLSKQLLRQAQHTLSHQNPRVAAGALIAATQ